MWMTLSAPLSVFLTFLLFQCSLAGVPQGDLMGLGAALLDSDFMPPSLLLQSQAIPLKTQQATPVNNATVTVALSTMNFHRKMMNEYLCRGYMAEDILERLQRDADEPSDNSLQQRRGSSANNTRRPAAPRGQPNHRSNQLITDEGSTNYRDWLARSAVLEDIYRRYEHVGPEDEEDHQDISEDRHGDSRDEDYDGEVTGWAMEESHYNGGKHDVSRQPDDDLVESYGHHQHEYAEPVHAGSSASSSALSLGIRDIFDVALTAIALLAFGIFILNVFLGILLPNSSTRTVVISNLTLPFRNREGALDVGAVGSGDFTHERIARWVAEEPERLETPEEGAARLALGSLKAALMPLSKQAHCVQAALCKGNKESRELEGHSKYWLPVWSLGMSWLARRGVGDAEPGTSALFSGALENLRAATLGLAGARCHELFPQC